MRPHPFFSAIGCLGGLLLIAGIVTAVLLSGGAIFSPGELTAQNRAGRVLKGFETHAEFQNDCTQCHAPMAGIAAERCQACHTQVGQERAAGTGLHGRLRPAQISRCAECHSDHHGADFDPNVNALARFDHHELGFALDRHIVNFDGTPLTCANCHLAGGFKFVAATCVACHGDQDWTFIHDHTQAFGQACRDCHDGLDATSGFDHAQTEFPLVGRHAALACAACHQAKVPTGETPAACAACHQEPPVHAGMFKDQACSNCHTEDGWSPVLLPGHPAFAHTNTTFPLVNHTVDFDGTPLVCTDCHRQAGAGSFSVAAPTCATCHQIHAAGFMQAHIEQYGPKCLSCHDGAGNMQDFDHARFFPLEGAHAAVACAGCHADGTYHGTPRACAACHAEPDIHAGIFGTQCEACHTTSAWTPAQLTIHAFPLDHGGEGEIDCATCHMTTYTTYTCTNCHAHDPAETQQQHAEAGITGDRLQECAACHATGLVEERN